MSEKFIIIDVGAKIQTIADCVKLKPAQSYAKTITQGIEYNGNAGVSLVITNYCTQPFNVPSIEWFTDTEDGGNFRAYTDAFTILASQEISVPLKFKGTYLSDTLSHIYNLNLNGNTSTFNLTINVPFVNHPPIVKNFDKLLENRAEYTFTLADFSSNFTDADSDSLDLVNIIGDVSNFKLNGVSYVSGGDITVYNLNNGHLKYTSPSVNSASQKTVSYTANDIHGAKSNVATITMNSKAFCTAPTLTSVDKINNNTVTFIWNNNGVEYGSSATISLEVSTDGGTNYTSIMNVSPSASPHTISSGVINSIANGSAVKFRVTSNGSPCNTQNSNVITLTWTKLSEIFVSDIVSANGYVTYKLNVLFAPFVGYLNSSVTKYDNTKIATLSGDYESGNTAFPSFPINQHHFNSNEVSIPVGVHDLSLSLSGAPIYAGSFECQGAIGFSTTDDYYTNLERTYVGVIYSEVV